MSYELACQLSGRIAAIASVTGSMSAVGFINCNADRPMPILEIHGTNDAVVVSDGLREGEFVITDGVTYLGKDSKVKLLTNPETVDQ